MRGLNTKLSSVVSFPDIFSYDIFGLTETWFSPHTDISKFFPTSNFSVFRDERSLRKGGGVLLAINSSFRSSRVNIFLPDSLKAFVNFVAIQLFLNNTKLIILLLYIPPSIKINLFSKIFECFQDQSFLLKSNLLVLGDFNIPHFIEYLTLSNSNDLFHRNNKSEALLSFARTFNLAQYNNVKNNFGQILDLVLSPFSLFISRALIPMVNPDNYHPPLSFSFLFQSESHISSVPSNSLKFKRGDYESLYFEFLSLNLNEIFIDNNIESQSMLLTKIFKDLINKHIPTFNPNSRKNGRRYPPWYTLDIIRDIKLKRTLLRRYRQNHNEFLKLELNSFCINLKNKIHANV